MAEIQIEVIHMPSGCGLPCVKCKSYTLDQIFKRPTTDSSYEAYYFCDYHSRDKALIDRLQEAREYYKQNLLEERSKAHEKITAEAI
jgi:hypothetical protein